MKTRIATARDAQSIAELHIASWQQNYTNALNANYLNNIAPAERKALWAQRFAQPQANQQVFVAENSSELVGFACVYHNYNPKWGAYLDNLHVASQCQGLGVGKQLLQAVASWCLTQNNSANAGMCLLVNRNNTNAQAFYLHLGARNAEQSVWHAPDGSDVPTFWFVWDSMEPLLK